MRRAPGRTSRTQICGRIVITLILGTAFSSRTWSITIHCPQDARQRIPMCLVPMPVTVTSVGRGDEHHPTIHGLRRKYFLIKCSSHRRPTSCSFRSRVVHFQGRPRCFRSGMQWILRRDETPMMMFSSHWTSIHRWAMLLGMMVENWAPCSHFSRNKVPNEFQSTFGYCGIRPVKAWNSNGAALFSMNGQSASPQGWNCRPRLASRPCLMVMCKPIGINTIGSEAGIGITASCSPRELPCHSGRAIYDFGREPPSRDPANPLERDLDHCRSRAWHAAVGTDRRFLYFGKGASADHALHVRFPAHMISNGRAGGMLAIGVFAFRCQFRKRSTRLHRCG